MLACPVNLYMYEPGSCCPKVNKIIWIRSRTMFIQSGKVFDVQKAVDSPADTLRNKIVKSQFQPDTPRWWKITERPQQHPRKINRCRKCRIFVKCEQVRTCDLPTSTTHLRPVPCWRMRRFNMDKVQASLNLIRACSNQIQPINR